MHGNWKPILLTDNTRHSEEEEEEEAGGIATLDLLLPALSTKEPSALPFGLMNRVTFDGVLLAYNSSPSSISTMWAMSSMSIWPALEKHGKWIHSFEAESPSSRIVSI